MTPMVRQEPSRVSRPDLARRRARYSRWRAGTLILVHVLMSAHIIHWLACGKTLAPLEFNEVMHTLELGIVTAGFLFMSTAMLATLLFGRFFCSWGCHILALQDLCAWLLARVGIRPKAIRSRVLLWVPVVAAGYMFVWPQVVRLWAGREVPLLHVRTDRAGWASFMTENFWRNLPSPGIALLTFGIVGFLIVFVLGSRSFCAYGCPYGAVFGLLDRFAPGRIRLKPGQSCEQCGICTAGCQSHVRVHEEIARYGMIVDSACEKDLDCIAVCPSQSLHYGFGPPAILGAVRAEVAVRKTYDFEWYEECVLLLAFLACVLVFRGLYDRIPFFLSIGLGAIIAYCIVTLLQLLARTDVSWTRRKLKFGGRWTALGSAYFVGMMALLVLVVHSGLVHFHSSRGRRLAEQIGVQVAAEPELVNRALGDLTFSWRWGLVGVDRDDLILADLYRRQSRLDEAAGALRRVLGRNETHVEARLALGQLAEHSGRLEEALTQYQVAVATVPSSHHARYRLAGALFSAGQPDEAAVQLQECIRLDPAFASAHYDLGALLVERGDTVGGIAHLRRAVELEPANADAHYNLSVALAMTGALTEAEREIEHAAALRPGDLQTQAFRRYLRELRDDRALPKTPSE